MMTPLEFKAAWLKACEHPDATFGSAKTGGMLCSEDFYVTVGRLSLSFSSCTHVLPIQQRHCNSIVINGKFCGENGKQTSMEKEDMLVCIMAWKRHEDKVLDNLYAIMEYLNFRHQK